MTSLRFYLWTVPLAASLGYGLGLLAHRLYNLMGIM